LLTTKVKKLAQLVRQANHIVVHTGAGVSTSAGIPDFRGPRGVWTLEKEVAKKARASLKKESAPGSTDGGTEAKKEKVQWADAKPTATHMCLVGMHRGGKLQYTISQNVDGLHLRSGIPRDRLAELHGNLFTEVCTSCLREVMYAEDLGGVGFKPTGRTCDACQGVMTDNVLDWDDALPQRYTPHSYTTHTPLIHHSYTTHTTLIQHSYTTHTPHSYTTHTPLIHHSYTTHTPLIHHTHTPHAYNTHTPLIHHTHTPHSYTTHTPHSNTTRIDASSHIRLTSCMYQGPGGVGGALGGGGPCHMYGHEYADGAGVAAAAGHHTEQQQVGQPL
jgi:NAD-dependent SIR2 family protein deacetylase